VGAYSYQTCLEFGLTGVMARCTGLKRDVRLDSAETYANYYYANFRGFVGQKGDSYDRFLLRMNEMTESVNIINQVVKTIMLGGKMEKNSKMDGSEKKNKLLSHELLKFINPHKVNSDNFKNSYNSMESLIDHFKY
jgi:NADH-quinone oxidoreductase subunit D